MEISVEKLGELQPEDCVICDIRGEHDRAYGFIPGSVGISAEELLTSPPGDGMICPAWRMPTTVTPYFLRSEVSIRRLPSRTQPGSTLQATTSRPVRTSSG